MFISALVVIDDVFHKIPYTYKGYLIFNLVLGFHNFIEINMICQLSKSINDTGKTKRKYF